MKKLLMGITSLLLVGQAYATTSQASYKSLKSRAMGGTTILSEASDEALLSNPAMLNFIDRFELNLLGVEFNVGDNTLDLYDSYTSMLEEIDKIKDETKIIELLQAYLDGESVVIDGTEFNKEKHKIGNEKLALEAASVISFVKHNFGIGVFNTLNINDVTLVDNPSSPTVNIDLKANTEIPIGFAFDFGNKDQFAVGLSARYLIGAGIKDTYTASDLADMTGDSANSDSVLNLESYSGYGFNLGTVWKTDYLNYALTVNDLISSITVDSKDDAGNKVSRSDKLGTNVSIAISNKYHDYERDGNWFNKNIFWTAELKNIFSADLDGDGKKDDNFWKKVHLGTETKLLDSGIFAFDLRVGLNQGYLSFGFGTEVFSFLNVEYANYTRELGPHLGMKEERLHSLAFNIRI